MSTSDGVFALPVVPHTEHSEAHPEMHATEPTMMPPDQEAVLKVLRACYDPCCRERGVSIVDLGLIQEVRVHDGQVAVAMLLTSGWCPFSMHLTQMIETEVGRLPGVKAVDVEIVWNPVWTPERMSDEARRRLTLPMAQLLPLREARLRKQS
jgi:metal-sulfur cluster biosynthetic enzyme